jgi:hypothetical protein
MKGLHLKYLGAACLASAALACAKVDAGSSGSGGTGAGAHPGTGGSGTGGGLGGPDASPDQGPVEKFSGEVKTCTDLQFNFAPKIPNVLVLVDGSGSMFDMFMDSTGAQTTRWDALKKAVLPIIAGLETQVNFGLAVFSGSIANKQCPIFKTVPIAPNNAAAIGAAYPTRATLDPSGGALETPLTMAMPMIQPLFAAATGNGNNYILLATDGEPDFCDNGNVTCPIDGVNLGLQQLAIKGFTTYVIGLTSNIVSSTCPMVLQAYANAGQNLAIANPCPGHTIAAECNGESHWAALASGAGRAAGQSLVDYVATGGGAKVYSPDVADQTSLTNTLAGLFNGVKSCTFDLSNLNGMSIKVDRTMLDLAHIKIMGTEVPLDDTNGWRMSTDTQLELTGAACDAWRNPATTTIDFMFPCEVFIVG